MSGVPRCGDYGPRAIDRSTYDIPAFSKARLAYIVASLLTDSSPTSSRIRSCIRWRACTCRPRRRSATRRDASCGWRISPASTAAAPTAARCPPKRRPSDLPRRPTASPLQVCAPHYFHAKRTHYDVYASVLRAALPLDLPRITGLVDTYAVDDMLTLECVSGAGDPTPQLTWYINNQPVSLHALSRVTSY